MNEIVNFKEHLKHGNKIGNYRFKNNWIPVLIISIVIITFYYLINK